ncbi:MAG: hypothetical protein ACFFDN_24305 [Candidatus Hodarchaeota archaeon]
MDIYVEFKFDRTIEMLLLLFLLMPKRVNPSRFIIIGVISAIVVASVILAIVFAIRRKQSLRIKETVTKPLSEKLLDKSDIVSADLICPSCKTPLKKKRPTKCEYCGRLIE